MDHRVLPHLRTVRMLRTEHLKEFSYVRVLVASSYARVYPTGRSVRSLRHAWELRYNNSPVTTFLTLKELKVFVTKKSRQGYNYNE